MEAHDVTDGPSDDLPALLALVLVCFKKILIWLEIWQHGQITPEASPTQLEDQQWKELHDVIGRTDRADLVLHVQRSYRFLGEKRPLLHVEDVFPIGRTAFGENEKRCILTRLLNHFLPISDGH